MRTAVVQSVFDFAMREINALEGRIVKAEDEADDMLWDQARQVVQQLKAGMKQRELAKQWINARTGEPYSQRHVAIVLQIAREYLDIQPRPRFRDVYNEITHAPAKAKHQQANASSDNPEHYTPLEIIDAVVACLGTIDLDPCSNSGTTPNVPARRHYTVDDDGLSKPWNANTLFMNPPYGDEIDAWVTKLCEEHTAGHVSEAIALLPARPDTQWFGKLRDYIVCNIRGRLTFIGNDYPAPFPSVVFYLGEDIGKFYSHFSDFGDIWQRIEPGMFGE